MERLKYFDEEKVDSFLDKCIENSDSKGVKKPEFINNIQVIDKQRKQRLKRAQMFKYELF